MATTSSIFFNIHPHFPMSAEETIDTIEFLNASKGIVWLIDQFGFGFEPVKNDIQGNIEKLNRKYEENTIEHRCLKKMILIEKRQGENFATESLLWLRRGLSFMSTFLQIYLEKEREEKIDENLYEVLALAYEKTLKSHHGFFTQILFKVLCNRCPNRSRFLEILGYPQIGCTNTFLSMMDTYLSKLLLNLEVLVDFCRRHNIEPYH